MIAVLTYPSCSPHPAACLHPLCACLQKYMPKEVAAAIALNKAKQEEEAASAAQPAVLLTSAPPPGTVMRGRPQREDKKRMRQAPGESQAYEVSTG